MKAKRGGRTRCNTKDSTQEVYLQSKRSGMEGVEVSLLYIARYKSIYTESARYDVSA